jgi:wyosine [tRNA(Phe)-imidazoG37] synthetase (radical SAM superfamily)
MYKYLFGPVPSRRLGMSLGVDLIPHKVCSFNCVYCECGPTTNLTTERKEYVPVEQVEKELRHFFDNNPEPDYITFSGAGEPTLNSRMGEVVNFIKKNWQHIPLAVLTNGSLLIDKKIRDEISIADVVLPSLDAASEKTFCKINRPFYKINIKDYIRGLIEFRKEYKGQIWLEVFILPHYNDNKRDVELLKEAFLRIKPDIIQINTLDRPGTVKDLRAANREEMQKIRDAWNLDNVEIISSVSKRKDIKSYRKDVETAILETIARRPCTADDLAEIIGTHVNEISKYLGVLEEENKIETIRQERGIFYKRKGS